MTRGVILPFLSLYYPGGDTDVFDLENSRPAELRRPLLRSSRPGSPLGHVGVLRRPGQGRGRWPTRRLVVATDQADGAAPDCGDANHGRFPDPQARPSLQAQAGLEGLLAFARRRRVPTDARLEPVAEPEDGGRALAGAVAVRSAGPAVAGVYRRGRAAVDGRTDGSGQALAHGRRSQLPDVPENLYPLHRQAGADLAQGAGPAEPLRAPDRPLPGQRPRRRQPPRAGHRKGRVLDPGQDHVSSGDGDGGGSLPGPRPLRRRPAGVGVFAADRRFQQRRPHRPPTDRSLRPRCAGRPEIGNPGRATPDPDPDRRQAGSGKAAYRHRRDRFGGRRREIPGRNPDAGSVGWADPQPHALRAAGAVNQAVGRRRPRWRRKPDSAAQLRRLGRRHPRRLRRPRGGADRLEGRRHDRRLGYPVPAALVPDRHDPDGHRLRLQPVGVLRVSPAALGRRLG